MVPDHEDSTGSSSTSLALTPRLTVTGQHLIVLSVFDGIGTGILALTQLVGEPRLTLAWEIDPTAIQITSHHLPFVKHRGDFTKDSPEEIAHLVRRHDPHQQCAVMMLGAPPCPDFSSINQSAESFQGKEGSKFDSYISFTQDLEQKLQGWLFIHMCENVVMQTQAEVNHVSQGLQADPVVIDAADLGIISRPRVFWTRYKWGASDTHPLSGQPLRWGSHHKIPRLYMDYPLVEADQLDFDGYTVAGVVARHEKRLPCLTTPAPTPEGRPPPKKLRGKMEPDCRERWMADSRRFAPWHYHQHALLWKGEEYTVPWACHKDQLQGFEKNYTAVGDTSEHDRHRLLGNSWHLQVAKFLLLILLTNCPLNAEAIPTQPKETSLQFVCRLAQHEPPALGTTSPFPSSAAHRSADDMWDHWRVSSNCVHPILAPPTLEPGLLQTMAKWMDHFSDIPRMRQEIVDEINNLVDLWQDWTAEWFRSRLPHIQAVYLQHSNQRPTQVPLFLYLLEQTGFPAMEHVVDDMTNGFNITAHQHPGPGWPVRTDERYRHPISDEQFATLNRVYIHSKLKKGFVDPHWKSMLNEIITECDRGRMRGPFSSPSDWPVETVTAGDRALLTPPSSSVRASVCFAVEQHDKVRKCEDFKRSWHNSTMVANDAPVHHGVDYYVQLCRWLSSHDLRPMLWAHDLDAAYRQFPVRDLERAWTVLHTPQGPTLWQHLALPFGAAGSVWAFNRAADLIQWLARKLLWVPLLHYVDDFGSAEPEQLAQSGFECFSQMFGALGFLMKQKKALPPSRSQKLLGVVFDIQDTQILLCPCPARAERLKKHIGEVLAQDELRPEVAQKLCGKLVFLQTTSFGQMGRSLLLPIYSRAHSSEHSTVTTLNGPLRTALTTLSNLLESMPPRQLPLTTQHECASLYTDAFFQMGDRQVKPTEDTVPRSWQPSSAQWTHNGWGFALRTGGQVLAAHGVIPPSVLHPYSRRRAFIYVLELMAPLIAIMSLHSQMPRFLILWIDNKAGLSALAKGYGRDPAVNNMLTLMWCFLARTGIHLHCEWVPSAHNLADGISRHDLSEAKTGGWRLLDIPLKPLHQILQRCANDVDFASTSAVRLVLDWSSSLVIADLALVGQLELEMVGTLSSAGHVAHQGKMHQRTLQLGDEKEKELRCALQSQTMRCWRVDWCYVCIRIVH